MRSQASGSPADPLIVFVSGLYPSEGSDSVSIQHRDYLIGLHDRGVPVGALDMTEQGSLSTLVNVARAITLHSSVRGWERAGIWSARQILRHRWLLAPAVTTLKAIRGLRRWSSHSKAPHRDARPAADSDTVKVRGWRMPRASPASPWASAERVACVVNGYDLLFSPQWGSVWREFVTVALRQACPRATRVQWFVHVVNETTRVAPALVQGVRCFDEVWPAAQFEAEALQRSGLVHSRVHKIGEAVDTDLFRFGVAPALIPGRRRICFLTLSQYGLGPIAPKDGAQSTHELALLWNHARKASEVLLRAFVEEFKADEDVCLVIKSTRPVEQLRAELSSLLATLGASEDRLAQLIPMGGWTDRRDMPGLYAASDALVLVSRGEGWGRPLAEAMAMGVPAVGTRFGGNMEFMTADNSYLVDYTPVRVSDTIGPKFARLGEWAEPSVEHLRAQLRAIVSHPDEARRRGARAAEDIRRHYTRGALADAILQRVRAAF